MAVAGRPTNLIQPLDYSRAETIRLALLELSEDELKQQVRAVNASNLTGGAKIKFHSTLLCFGSMNPNSREGCVRDGPRNHRAR